MAVIYRAPEKEELNLLKGKPSVFLAGSIDMGKATQWQKEMEEYLADEDVIIFNPRRLDFKVYAEYSEDNPYLVEQIEWELEHIDKSDVVIFFFDPSGKAPITLYEMGLVSERAYTLRKKCLVYCPEGYWKRANVIVNANYYDFFVAHSMEDFKLKTKQLLDSVDKNDELRIEF